jgi:glycosyltransferase involved in cell wall biosynthesis
MNPKPSTVGVGTRSRNDYSIVTIIPLYNGARWIEGAIGSVLSQTLQPDEIVIVNDGSSDDGPMRVEKLAAQHPQIKLVHKANGGQSSARNLGVRRSTSSLIALLDQDDEWYPNHLEQLVKPFREPRAIPLGWTYSDLDEIDETGGLIHRHFLPVVPLLLRQPVPHPKTSLGICLSQDMFILPSASLISREAFVSIGGFDERLCGYEDDDLFIRMFYAGYDNVFINESLSKWRIYPSSTSYTERMSVSRKIYAQKLFITFPDDCDRGRYWVRDCIAPRFVSTVLREYLSAIDNHKADYGKRALNDLATFVPYLSGYRRILLSMALPFMRVQLLARAVIGTRRVVRFATRMLVL